MDILNYKKIQKEGLVLTGLVAAAKEDGNEDKTGDVLFIENPTLQAKYDVKEYTVEAENQPIIGMFRDRIGIIYQKGPLSKYIGNKISFKIEDIAEKDGMMIAYASLRMISEERREKAIAELQSNDTIKATIKKIKNKSAYLVTKNKTPLIMRQKDFSTDWTPIDSILKAGDVIDVKLEHISEHKRIFVRMPELYSAEVDLDKYEENMSLEGTIISVEAFGCFVRLAPGVDMLCPIPRHLEAVEGMKVKARITQLHKDTKKLRGKIMGEIDLDKYVLDYEPEETLDVVE